MGCKFTKQFHSERNPRLFKVYNVNNLGAVISPGKIEVTDLDLIFYQRRKEPITWPLRCLRRYGFDEDLFSFESGRRCPTGSGIYAFRCHQAEELFNLVQEAIQNVGASALGNLRSSLHLQNGISVPMTQLQSRPVSLVDTQTANRLPDLRRGNEVSQDQHLYLNSGAFTPDENGPNYVNTGASNAEGRNEEAVDQAAALIDFLHDPPMAVAPPPPKPESVNYADLDLPGSMENVFEACAGATGVSSSMGQGHGSSGSSGQEGLEVDDVNLNYADIDVFHDHVEDSHPNYINLDSEGKIKDKTVSCGKVEPPIARVPNGTAGQTDAAVNRRLLERKLSIEQNYANVGAASFTNIPEPNPVIRISMNPNGPAMNSVPNRAANRLSAPDQLNYIEIDVNKTESDNMAGSASSNIMTTSFTTPDSPCKSSASYAMIDFNRTVALSNSAKPVSEHEEGLRKTRHNSTIN
ncbi:fibroblast growth factor receptor substrate 3-like [Dreissena polymorpha]|uniref:IRS-type PTB domain-containing protein n=1 Tax=Dreissena polymorpha TaxID=45954 RepID=A0A9D4I282_DREPO|nr:fibroblast growth factor receptor substrate 3-like [Dreissena polymorpha]KAH3739751.1 hypothetical protein DPMN_046438 [Dreissena polymorpha]